MRVKKKILLKIMDRVKETSSAKPLELRFFRRSSAGRVRKFLDYLDIVIHFQELCLLFLSKGGQFVLHLSPRCSPHTVAGIVWPLWLQSQTCSEHSGSKSHRSLCIMNSSIDLKMKISAWLLDGAEFTLCASPELLPAENKSHMF